MTNPSRTIARGVMQEEPPSGSVLRPTRRMWLDGLPLRPHTQVELDRQGRVRRGVLDADCTFDELPLAGGTEVEFDPTSGELVRCTLREPTMLGAIPCAAGDVTLRVGRHRRQAVSVVLSRDCQLRAAVEPRHLTSQRLSCRGGTRVTLRPGVLHARLISFSPRRPMSCWGFRCAAKRPVDIERRSATLADDHVFDAILLPAGSRFSHDRGQLPGGLAITLSRSVSFDDHRLPAGAKVEVSRELVQPIGPLARWLSPPRPTDVVLRVKRDTPWTIVDLRISADTEVDLLQDGGVRFRADRDLVIHGVLYPGGSEVELTPNGYVRRWKAGPGGSSRADHPYRVAAEAG